MKIWQLVQIWARNIKGLTRPERTFLVIGALVGSLHLAADLGVAYGFRHLFIAVETLRESPASNPPASINLMIGIVIVMALVRGGMIWALEAGSVRLIELFKLTTRQWVVRSVLQQRLLNSRAAVSLVNEESSRAGLALGFLFKSVGHFVAAVGLLIAMLVSAPALTGIVLSLSLLLAIPVLLLVKLIQKRAERTVHVWRKTHRLMLRGFEHSLYLKLCRKTQTEQDEINAGLVENFRLQTSAGAISAINLAYVQFAGLTALVMIIGWAVHSRSSVVLVVPVIYLMVRLVQKCADCSRTVSHHISNYSFFERVLAWRSEAVARMSKAKSTPLETQLPRQDREPAIGWHLHGAELGHHTIQGFTPVLQNVSGTIQPGTCVGLVGPSGSGKTTLIRTLLGEALPRCGQVLASIQNQRFDVAAFAADVLDRTAYVGPHGIAIDGTIKENLLFGVRRPVSDGEIENVLRTCECSFVFHRQLSLNSQLEAERLCLSTGELQRLSLAAALLRRPLALILDEATANLDEENEKAIIAALHRIKGQITIVVAAHKGLVVGLADETWDVKRWAPDGEEATYRNVTSSLPAAVDY